MAWAVMQEHLQCTTVSRYRLRPLRIREAANKVTNATKSIMKRQKPQNFSERVYAIVAKIPKGKTMTYGQVAARAGNPGAARAVGTLMSKNYNREIPCDRVVRSDAKVGGYALKRARH